MKQIKVIVAGTFRYDMYQEALSYGLETEDAQVIRLKLDEDRPYNRWLDIVNGRKLLSCVKEHNPDILFLYRVENLHPLFVKLLKRRFPQVFVMQYHNDDPFRKGVKRYIKSYNYLHYIKYTDMTYVYRPVNLEEAKSWGARNVGLYMSHYYSKNDCVELRKEDCHKKNGQIVFVGHSEDDERISYIDTLFEKGLNLHVYGDSGWKFYFSQYGWPKSNLHPGQNGLNYRKTISSASLALAFFSRANRDEYTRRCFEIPIMGTAILAPATEITSKIYKRFIRHFE